MFYKNEQLVSYHGLLHVIEKPAFYFCGQRAFLQDYLLIPGMLDKGSGWCYAHNMIVANAIITYATVSESDIY